ncbi:hypothetical protein HELRODRAFT_192110 [Helobdella robusta]|uniref:Kinesin motor domain-containing protein n=1 Tax=Helobdella robusta TaxID=6412 RepID=T1FTL0_HELRO|nr:hypothetical protein HELRODRAFT_192110 [Helobdella robusta]ESO03085.1 hypothetical protein HELRODRAFT_192110 [Helobdella robusta]
MGDSSRIIPVKVAVRCRPLIQKEENEGCQGCLQFVPAEPQLIVGKDKAFTFDYVFNPSTSQQTVYSVAVSPLVKGLFKGYNATVLAYGQTGSGKTFSMGGGYGVCMETNEDAVGIIPRVIRDLFEGISKMQDKFEFIIKVSYLELYKEDLLDLFVPVQKREKDQVVIRDDVSGGIKLTGMSEIEVHTYEETMRALEEGSQGRTIGATAMNNQSSRSHAIFTIHLDRKSKLDRHKHQQGAAGTWECDQRTGRGVIGQEGPHPIQRQQVDQAPPSTKFLRVIIKGNLSWDMHIDSLSKKINKTIGVINKIKVQELQSNGVAANKRISIGGVEMETEQYRTIIEKNRKLEDENRHLVNELQIVITQNTEMMDKVVRTEVARDKMKEQLDDLKEQALKEMECLKECQLKEDTSMQTSALSPEVIDQQLSIMIKFKDKLCQIETGDVDERNNMNDDEDNTKLDDLASPGEADGQQADELKSRHVLRQAQLNRELQNLNNMLHRKQELATQMQSNEKQMQEMKEQYEQQMKEMETEVEKLQKEKEEAVVMMHSLKSNAANSKLAEQRRKRVQELESQIQELKRKMSEQMRMLKMKEQNEKQVEKLNQEIISMKQQRVKLMNQLKDDAEQFRKMKAEMTKEVLQLKSQDRKRQAEMAKLERQHVNQQVVLKRKAEEAAAANNRLKEVLMRQKMVMDDRNKKQEAADLSGAGARIKKLIGDEMDLMVSVEEARIHLNQQMSSRKEMNEQATCIRNKLNIHENQVSECMSDEEKSSLALQLKELEQQIELCTVQIADLQQKLIDADQDEKCKSRWDNIHTIVESKIAIKFLLNMAVSLKVEGNKKNGEMEDLKAMCKELTQMNEKMQEGTFRFKLKYEQDMCDLRKENESKVLYLLSQMKNNKNFGSRSEVKESERIEELKKRIEFQEKEIEKFRAMEEELNNKTEVINNLRREMTKKQYNLTMMRGEGTLLPTNIEADIKTEFFNPPTLTDRIRKRPTKRRSNSSEEEDNEVTSDEFEDEDDVTKDPSYRSGLTPAPARQRSRQASKAPQAVDSSSSSSSLFNRTFITSDNGVAPTALPPKKKVGERRKKTGSSKNENNKPLDSTGGSNPPIDLSEVGVNSFGKKRKLQPLKSATYFTDQI